MPELLVGCGSNLTKKIFLKAKQQETGWTDLVTLDFNDDHKPDVVHDIASLPLPFPDDHFDEIHAYDVLEHVGQQGDFKFFFAQWSDFWRMLKPDGLFMCIAPHINWPWGWGDPGHTRAMCPEQLAFLSQQQYVDQVGKTPMTDYRFCYKADFEIVDVNMIPNAPQFYFMLKAIKPSRIAA